MAALPVIFHAFLASADVTVIDASGCKVAVVQGSAIQQNSACPNGAPSAAARPPAPPAPGDRLAAQPPAPGAAPPVATPPVSPPEPARVVLKPPPTVVPMEVGEIEVETVVGEKGCEIGLLIGGRLARFDKPRCPPPAAPHHVVARKEKPAAPPPHTRAPSDPVTIGLGLAPGSQPAGLSDAEIRRRFGGLLAGPTKSIAPVK